MFTFMDGRQKVRKGSAGGFSHHSCYWEALLFDVSGYVLARGSSQLGGLKDRETQGNGMVWV